MLFTVSLHYRLITQWHAVLNCQALLVGGQALRADLTVIKVFAPPVHTHS